MKAIRKRAIDNDMKDKNKEHEDGEKKNYPTRRLKE
jgi:hypothetical protein